MVDIALLAFAFSAGAATVFNPCGFAVFVAYLSRQLSGQNRNPIDGLKAGAAVTLSFLAVFISIGLLISIIGKWLLAYTPPLVILVGVGLVLWGFLTLFGKHIKFNLPFGFIQHRSHLGYGLGYSISSLGCTLPIFLAIIFQTFLAAGFIDSILVLLSYSAGVGIIMSIVTVFAISSRKHIIDRLKFLSQNMDYITAVILIIAGLYIIFYQYDSIAAAFGKI